MPLNLPLALALPLFWSVHLDDLHRFPDTACVKASLTFSHQHLQWLEARGHWDCVNGDELAMWMTEARSRRWAWSLLEDAQCVNYADEDRRAFLRSLKRHIGAEAYRRGELPACVPWERFSTVP